MNKLPGLLVLAGVILVVLFFYSNPEVLDKIWLWLVGFVGYLIMLFGKGYEKLKDLFKEHEPAPIQTSSKKSLEDKIKHLNITDNPELEKIKSLVENEEVASVPEALVTILRYVDDGNTTLGMLFIEKKFFAYTLEDTHRDEKIPGGTRIPEGYYKLGINENLSPLTQRYRNRFNWFKYHIEIKDIPNYDKVYVHIGNTHKDTEGCILIADGVNAANPEKMILQSQKAYERFYKIVYPKINQNEPLAINILNENWFERLTKKKQLVNA
ncbi:DUF5675 family protein [Cyclobacterium sp. 1_MG-2023]|uniref:DUF5675 family protein n=1 Tax=Cyclobacterium sp. 1_MG-2023 TaxID=3062681 RepID=UPI0026E27551|nr:DUF5675 family protein [Cyclobacterium sp. 1_MG-2023]MDO6436134.1 DUF5675 family protein [Cyclobacterium sp. 1_MG-2023]